MHLRIVRVPKAARKQAGRPSAALLAAAAATAAWLGRCVQAWHGNKARQRCKGWCTTGRAVYVTTAAGAASAAAAVTAAAARSSCPPAELIVHALQQQVCLLWLGWADRVQKAIHQHQGCRGEIGPRSSRDKGHGVAHQPAAERGGWVCASGGQSDSCAHTRIVQLRGQNNKRLPHWLWWHGNAVHSTGHRLASPAGAQREGLWAVAKRGGSVDQSVGQQAQASGWWPGGTAAAAAPASCALGWRDCLGSRVRCIII